MWGIINKHFSELDELHDSLHGCPNMEVLDVPTPMYIGSYITKKYVAKDGSEQSCFQPRRACGITIRLGSRTSRVSSTSSFTKINFIPSPFRPLLAVPLTH
jgi:hypothetical protein